ISAPMSAVPNNLSQCEFCHKTLTIPHDANSTLAGLYYLLKCGHVLCDGCRIGHAAAANGKVWCRVCRRLYECLVPPSKQTPAPESSPCVSYKRAASTPVRCAEHAALTRLMRCSCGKVICIKCTKSSHARHFPYKDLFEIEERLRSEKEQIPMLRQFLTAEEAETTRQLSEIQAKIDEANTEIASKCTVIIAQAISRCLDLMAQTEKVGLIRQEVVKDRMKMIRRKQGVIKNALEMEVKSSSDYTFRYVVQKKALEVLEEWRIEEAKRSGKVAESPPAPLLDV
ncbi:hypothetical protein PFISCL1PPCAC_21490, partial [Pristionchus fissidentatus]